MKFLSRIWRIINKIMTKSGNDCISAFSGEVTLFTLISFFPFMMVVLSIFPYTPLTTEKVMYVVNKLFSIQNSSIFHTIIDDVFKSTSGTVMSISIITLIWSASRVFLSIVNGLNVVYEVRENRGYIFLRVSAFFYTLAFAIMIIMTLVLLVFGNTIFIWVVNKVPAIGNLAVLIISIRASVILAILLLFFLIMYTVIPNRRSSFIYELPGAIVTSAGWFGFSSLYSYYVDNLARNSYMYGSLSTIVFLLIWLYFCMYIFFIGAEINASIKHAITRLRAKDNVPKVKQDK